MSAEVLRNGVSELKVDIRTGERRVAEFLLQPVLWYAAEGLRER